MSMSCKFAERMNVVKPSAIRELLRLGADPQIISFGGGYPDPAYFPRKELAQAYEDVLADPSAFALQYTTSAGLESLRIQIAARMQRDGVSCIPRNVLVVQGAQQGLDLISKLLINPRDLIVTENPTFLGALIAFNPCQPRYAAAPMGEGGVDIARLESILVSERGAKLIYLIPDFQNPTGVTMSVERRRAVIDLANRHDVVVVEDTPYRDIRFSGESLPTLKSLDTEERVMHVGSFSKILAPGLRLGWIVASEPLIEKLGLLKLAADTQCSTLNMAAVSKLLETFDLEKHVAMIAGHYRGKKELMLETIRRTFPPDVAYTNPNGGLFTWLSFPERFDTARFMQDRALPEAKVAYVPGATFFPVDQQTNHARVSFATQPDDAIVRGITALGRVLVDETSRSRRAAS
jgi:2-aminoadipate transaminase